MNRPSPLPAVRAAVEQLLGEPVGVGIDLVDIDVLRALVDDGGPTFVDAYWTSTEQAITEGDVTRLAGRWAAKEAVMKSMSFGVGEVDPIDIEIDATASGAPQVVLHAEAADHARTLGIGACLVSITHEAAWAAAIAIALPASNNRPSTGVGSSHV